MRTAPAPMFLLSGLVRDNRFKVVLSGEGADELLAGYDIFREAKIRRFWAEQPDSEAPPGPVQAHLPVDAGGRRLGLRQGVLRPGAHGRRRPGLLAQPPVADHRQGQAVLQRGGATRPPRPATAHLTPSYPDGFDRWGPLQQAQYLETTILLSQYLLSSQGDRMAMAHSVEGRFPFLDHRVVEFANQLPPSLKLNGLTEKYLLKEVSREWLPAEISDRPKQPYRAPIHRAFFNDAPPDYVEELLSSVCHRSSPATSTRTRWTSSSPSSSGACRWERRTTWPWPASSRPSWCDRQFVSSPRPSLASRRRRRREGRRRASGHPEGSSCAHEQRAFCASTPRPRPTASCSG